MLRTRLITASPARNASATWAVIADLVARTVEQSSSPLRADADLALAVAAPVGRVLIAAGHLDRLPITLVVGKVHCEITTVSGTAALTHEENLDPIPGAAAADTFTVYLPSPAPLQDTVAAAVASHPRLSDATPPAPRAAAARETTRSRPVLEPAALQQAVDRAARR